MSLSLSTREQQERGRGRFRQNGMTERIRDALRSGPLTARQLAQRLGVKRASVQALMSLISKASGVYRVGGCRRDGYVYSLTPPVTEAPFNPHVAGRITHGRGAKWGAGLV